MHVTSQAPVVRLWKGSVTATLAGEKKETKVRRILRNDVMWRFQISISVSAPVFSLLMFPFGDKCRMGKRGRRFFCFFFFCFFFLCSGYIKEFYFFLLHLIVPRQKKKKRINGKTIKRRKKKKTIIGSFLTVGFYFLANRMACDDQ